MSQPINQHAIHPALGELDTKRGEFWLENPWQQDDHNLSSYERNRVLLNRNGNRLLDVSHLTTADSDSDSRAVITGDFTGDGMPDVLVRSVGGGALRLFENRWPKTHWLRVSLRGVKSNSLGLGAKLKFHLGKKVVWRDLNPLCSYQSQMPAEILLGLGSVERVDRITVFWPSGETGHYNSLPANRHVVLTEGHSDWKVFSATASGRKTKSD